MRKVREIGLKAKMYCLALRAVREGERACFYLLERWNNGGKGRRFTKLFFCYCFSAWFQEHIMTDYEQFRVFVGGLSWEISDRELENEFKRFGKVIDAKVSADTS